METTTDNYLKEQILRYKAPFLSRVTTISCAFLAAMNTSLYAALIEVCTCGSDPLFQSTYHSIIAEMYHPPHHCVHIHCFVSINQQALMDVDGCLLFAWRSSVTHLWFTCTFMTECPFVAIYYKARRCNRILLRRSTLCCHPKNICF